MKDKNDTPEEMKDTQEEDAQDEPDREDGPEESPMSRRDVLKKGAYAAPAIMAVGSVPRFAAGQSCSPGNSGDNSSSEGGDNAADPACEAPNGGNGNNGNGNSGGQDSGTQSTSPGGGGYGSSSYGSDDYGSSEYGSSEYGSNGHGSGN